MSDDHIVAAKPAPPLNVPTSNATVKVSCIDSTSRMRLPMSTFLQPDYEGNPDLTGPSFSFLIEHATQKVLFDLGIRSDWHNLPSYPKFVELKWEIHVEKDVATILHDHEVNVDASAIGTIILSHHHWDHVGNAALFPKSTQIVVGPGFVKAHLPGFPEREDSVLLASDFDGRQVREIAFDDTSTKIGRFRAHDFFGDGSFYLLDTPGHSIGHICGLARTSVNPDTFVFMVSHFFMHCRTPNTNLNISQGGDACHHGGEFKPNAYTPLPTSVEPIPARWHASTCPGHLLQSVHPHNAANAPLYHVTKSFSHDKDLADWTIEGLGEFEADPHVLVLLAHDASIIDPPRIDLYPHSLNDWHSKDTARKIRWQFLADFSAAVQEKDNGGAPFRWGQYP